MISPIGLFTYKKLEPLQACIHALKKNRLAPKSELIIFSDGPKTESDRSQIEEVRSFIKGIDGFKKVTVHESSTNKGLATSVIEGISAVLKVHNSIIVLEDDLVTSTNFLNFMNQALTEYEADLCIHSISGYTVPIKTSKDYRYDNYFTQRASSWGWATWSDRWESVDWSVSDYDDFVKNRKEQKRFNGMGSDLSSMLAKQMRGKISSWAVRWCYHQFKMDQYTVFPIHSKVSNIGFGVDATHTKDDDNRFATPLDDSGRQSFDFDPNPHLNQHFIKQFTAKYSLRTRAYYKIKNLLGI